MENAEKLHVLRASSACLPILRAFNAENFKRIDRDSFIRNICLACGVMVIEIIFPMLVIVLGVWKIFDNDGALETVVVVIPPMLSAFQLFTTFITLAAKNRVISETLDQIQRVVNGRCKNSPSSHQNYVQVEQTYTFVTVFLVKVLCVLVIASFSASAMCPIAYFIFGYPPPQSRVLPTQMYSLLGGNNYLSFAIDWLIQLIGITAVALMFPMAGSLYSGVCLYIHGMVVDMKARISCSSASGSLHMTARASQWSIYVQEIDFHIEIIDLAEAVSHIMEMILFKITITCTVVIALSLLVIELYDLITMEALIAVGNLVVVPLPMLIYCFLSEWVTSDLLEIGEIFYNSEWYRLPNREQRLVALPVGRAQRVFRLRGLGLFDCSLAVFSTIVRTAGSYFIILRSFK